MKIDVLVLIFVRELAGGALSYAAVLRGGLGPPTPPLCRCAEYTACQLSQTWWAINCSPLTYLVRSLGTWCEQRSGIKEEPAGRGTAAKLFTPSAKACTEQALKARKAYSEAFFQRVSAVVGRRYCSTSYAIDSIDHSKQPSRSTGCPKPSKEPCDESGPSR